MSSPQFPPQPGPPQPGPPQPGPPQPAYGYQPPPPKRRRWLPWLIAGVVALFLLGACVAAVAGGIDDAVEEAASPASSAEPTPGVSQGLGSQDASGDVVLGEVISSEFGTVTLMVAVTNNSDKRSDYYINVAADAVDGSRLSTSSVFITGLEPGQATQEQAVFFDELPTDAVFKVLEVQRTASV